MRDYLKNSIGWEEALEYRYFYEVKIFDFDGNIKYFWFRNYDDAFTCLCYYDLGWSSQLCYFTPEGSKDLYHKLHSGRIVDVREDEESFMPMNLILESRF